MGHLEDGEKRIKHREGATDVGPPRWLSFGRHSSPSLSAPGLACGAEWQALPLSLTSCPSFGPVPWYKHPFPQSAPLLPVPSSSKLSLLRGAHCHTAVTSIPLPSPLLECRIRTEIPSPDPAQPLEEGPLSSQSTGCDPVSWTLSMTGAAGQTSRIQEVGVYRALQAPGTAIPVPHQKPHISHPYSPASSSHIWAGHGAKPSLGVWELNETAIVLASASLEAIFHRTQLFIFPSGLASPRKPS